MSPAWKARLKRGGLVAGLAAVVGGAVWITGVVPIGASSGHWDITAWFLHFSMQRSVAFHALDTEVPEDVDLEDAALVRRGAGHFEAGCRPCHGAPGDREILPLSDAMTPAPPRLTESARAWSTEELHWIVANGVKFTGMPAWPAEERYDEVWPVVAFLQAVPEMDGDEYEALVAISTPTIDESARACVGCHGEDGLGRDGTAPVLAGQREAYLRASMEAYARGARHSGIMEIVAARMDREAIAASARWFAARPGLTDEGPGPAGEGATLAQEGLPHRDVPSCADCHGPAAHEHDEAYPRLFGQPAWYLDQQLRLFAEGRRGGTARRDRMDPIDAHALTDAQRRAVAAYYAGAETTPR